MVRSQLSTDSGTKVRGGGGPLVGPLVAIIGFVCSVEKVPLAAVLWRGGISFGGVVSPIVANLIVLPVLDIYRRYYSSKVALYILGTFYVTMAAPATSLRSCSGRCISSRPNRAIGVIAQGPRWTYTTVLNIIFLAVAVPLVVRFLRTGGPAMLRMMNTPEQEMTQHDHAMAGIDHHAMGTEGMGHAGHAGDAGDCPRTAHRLLVLMTISFSGLPVPDGLRMQVCHPDESAVPGVIPDLAAVAFD